MSAGHRTAGALVGPILAAACVWSAPSRAADAAMPTSGLQLGARVGASWPTGTLSGGSALSTHLSDLETATVPIGIDAGYRFSSQWYLGGTVAWGPGLPPNSQGTCPANVSCFRQDAQLRVEARVYFPPQSPKKGTFWLGLGAGWEVAAFAQDALGRSVTTTLTGPVFADFEAGIDGHIRDVAIGPYMGVTVAEFVTYGENPAATPVSTGIASPAPHTWITFGIHGSYGPW
jgi:hypothetical protein